MAWSHFDETSGVTMNKTFAFSFSGTIAAIALLAATPLRAQTLPPTVVIHASDVSASEAGGGTNTGTFLIQRNFASSNSLVVFYSVSGTASNGVDYTQITNRVT